MDSVDELRVLAQDGGCKRFCDARLSCGHACPRRCHPDDPDHKARCLEACTKLAPCGLHPCSTLCYQTCLCNTFVTITLECGHEKEILCRERDKPQQCSFIFVRERPSCPHPARIPCHIETGPSEIREEPLRCMEKCQKPLPCEHLCAQICSQCEHNQATDALPPLCQQPNPHAMDCGHDCTGYCGHSQEECPPCTRSCPVACEHSRCQLQCGQACSLCAEPCTWKCDHEPTELNPLIE